MGVCCEPQEGSVMEAKKIDPKLLIKNAEDRGYWQSTGRLWKQNGLKENDGMSMETALPILKEIIRKQNAGKMIVPPTDEQIA